MIKEGGPKFFKKEESSSKKKIEKKSLENSSEKELTKEEKLEKLKWMANIIGEDFDMKIKIGKGWSYSFEPIDTLEMDAKDVEKKSLEYCLGLIAHEGAHKKISLIDFIPKDVWQKRGFSFLMNAVEDPRVNNWISEKYDGARQWLQKVYIEEIGKQENEIKKTAKDEVGYTPKHIQFGLEVIRYWFTGEFSKDLPKEVKEALEKTIKYAKLAYNCIPDPVDPPSGQIRETAKNMYKVVYSSMWPVYKKLVKEATKEEQKKKMADDMIDNGEINPEEMLGDSGKGLSEEEQKEELKKKFREEEGGKEKEEERRKKDQKIKEKIKKAIKNKLESMDEEERKDFEEKMAKEAEKDLDDLEEKENQKLKGKFKDQKDTKSEERKKKERKEKEEKRSKEIQKKEKEINENIEKEKSAYDHAYEEVQKFINDLAEEIINTLVSERWPSFRKSFPGQRLRLKGAKKYEARKEYQEMFESRKPKEPRKFNFVLLVDLSGSMRGDKIRETFKAVVLFAEALNRASSILGNLNVSIQGFQDVLLEYKDLDEKLDDKMREKLSIIKKEVHNRGENNKSNYNNDGYCLKKSADKLKEKEQGADNFIFVLSDGVPEGDSEHHLEGYSYSNEEQELKDVIKEISSEGLIKLLGIGLGSGTKHVKDYYSSELEGVDNIPNNKVEEIAEILVKKVKELIKK